MKSEKKSELKKAYDQGFKFERDYGSCSQCTFAAVSKVLGKGSEEIFQAIDGLAGGVARSTNGTCGALSGGVAMISLMYGRKEFPKLGTREKCMILAKKLYDKFIEEYGGILCKEIQTKKMGRSYDLWDPKEREMFDKAGGHTDVCPDVVGKAAKWTVEILLDEVQ
jgi:C_GCAxxG_C_C family probable redox protein